jgi:GTP-binding protein Era
MLVLSKTDLATPHEQEAQLAAARAEHSFERVVSVSAREGRGLARFVETAVSLLPRGPRWFPAGTTCDQPLEVLIAELIREKALLATFDEVPHALGVQVEAISFDKRQRRYSVSAFIYVERESQKGILVGRGGQTIKRIGTQARLDIERLLDASVYLDVRVKLRRGWRRDANQIRRFGYGEGA